MVLEQRRDGGEGRKPCGCLGGKHYRQIDRRDDLGLGVSLAHPGPKHGEGQGRESGKALVLGLRRLRSHWGSGRKKHSI